MFRKMNLRWKMLISIFVVACISFGFNIVFTEIKIRELAEKEALDKANQIAYHYAGIVKINIEKAMISARTLAFALEGIKNDLKNKPNRDNVKERSWIQFVPINIGDTNTPWSFAIVAPVDKIFKEVKKVISATILISIISLIIFLLVIYLIAYKISSSIKATSYNLQDIARGEGDLTKRIKVNSEDELGQLANWFNVFVDKLQQIIKGIVNETIKINQSVDVFIDISKHLSREMKEIDDNVNILLNLVVALKNAVAQFKV